MNPDKRDELYNNLINSGKVSEAEIGSLDDFKAAITDEASARLFHQNLLGSGIFGEDEIGSEDDFYSSISSDFAGTDVPQQPATSAAQGLPVNPATFAPMAPAAPSSGAVNVRAPFVNEEAQRQYEQQKPTSPTQPTNPAAAQNEQEQPLGPERFAKQMQMEQQLGQMSQDFTNRMEAIRKGNQPFGSGHQREFNPETGRMEDVYYTKAGERTNTPLAQWEENNKGLRLQQDIDQSLSALDGAAEAAWKTATEASGKEQSENIKMIARTGGFMPGGSGMGQLAMLNTASHLKYHDLQRMADDAWNSLGIVKQQAMIDGIYNTLRSHHYNDEASDEQLRAEAEAMARQENDRRLFDYAVKMNAPKDATDYFFRKALQNNAITMLKDFAARSMAGTTGDWEARDVAEQQYDKESLGHNLIGHAGGITGFLLDPTVLIGGAAAKGAVGGATKIVGRLAAKRGGAAWVAEKAPTLIGKTTTGVVAGAGNFGTFESAQEALRQLRWGGKIEIDEKTGRYKIDGYDLGEVAKKYGHGALMGGTIGVLGPLTGNVGDRLVGYINKTGKPGTVANIMDKLGARTVQTGVCKTAEGTIFSIPEWIDTYKKYGEMIDAVSDPESKNYIADDYQRAKKIEELKAERAAEVMDTWTENEKMMLGFGLQHMVKSIPQRITELRDIDNARTMEERNHNRRDWLSKLNRMLDGRPDLALTRDEKDELQRRGYTDLADLVSEYKRWEEEKAVTEKARPDAIDASRMIGEGEDAAIPYNRFLQLMEDPTVSEAARAKMYYYLTGRQAPMSTVMGWSPIEEVKDANGKVTGYNVKSLGAKGVITSRTFADKAAAEAELQKIYRQAELNTLDIGERYYEGRGLSSEDLRDYVGKRHGVDVDASIRKDPNRRSKAEQEAVDEYTERLYVGVKTEEAYQRGYDADEQGRQDAMMELAMSDPSDPDHAEKQAAVDGINQRINDDADMQVAQQREAYNLQRNDDDGSLHPATMTVDGQEREVYIKSGLITTGADGSIDIENSGETIVVYDPVEGKNKMVSPADIRSLGDVTTAEQFEADLQNQRADYVKQQQDAATGRFDPQPGQEIDMPDGGKAVVLATDGESVTLQMPDGTQQSMAIADIQQIADGVMMEDYRQRHPDTAAAEQPAVEAPAMTEGKPETFEPNMELTIKDGEGEKIVYVTGTRARWNPTVGYVEDPNGKFVELYDPEANDGNGGMTYIREDDPDGKIVGHKPMEQPAAEQTETPAETTEQAPEQPTENEQPTEAPTEEVQQPEPAASSIMPMKKVREKRNVLDENGNPVKDENGRNKKEWVEEEVEDWYAATPEDAYTYLYDEAVAAGLDEKDADGIVKLMQEQSQKELADVKKKPEPVAGSVMATLQLRKERNAETEEAQSHVDYWKQVQSLRNRALLERKEAEASERRANETEEQKAKREAFEAEQARRQAEAETAERRRKEEDEQKANGTFEAPVKNTKITEPIEGVKTSESPLAAAKRELADDTEAMEMLNNTEPQTLEEIASTLLRSGKNQVGIIPEDFYKHTGFSAADAKSMNFILSNSGVSMSRLGEMVEAAARNENIPFDENYANAGLDAVLAVLGNVRTQGDINSYITNNRIRQAYDYHDKMLSMEEDLWIEAHDGLTRAEYDAWEHSIEEDAAALNGQKYEDYYNKIAESTLNNYYDTGSETNDGRGPEAGTGTLQGQEGLQTTDTRDGSRRAEGSGSREKRGPAESAVAGRIAAAEAQTDTNPTEAQKKAGNYKMGHVTVDGYDISIENPKGSIRRGTDPNGRAWEQEMHNTYGYIRGTEGVDGDHIDIFLSDDPSQGDVFVIDQVNKDGSFDEHKVMYGFPDTESARAAYLSNYEDGWQGLGTITQVSKDEFKKWVESSHRKTKPFSEYKSVKPDGAQHDQRQPSTADYQQQAEKAIDDILNGVNRGTGVVVSPEMTDAIQRIADMEAEAEERLEDNTLSDDERARVQAQYDAASKWMDDNVRSQKGMPAAPTAEQKMLTKGLVGWLNNIGIKTHAAVRKGQEVLNKYRELVRALRAYHGSGADFDRFDHSHMGEGEGAQAYGYGSYVTEVEGIGRTYAESAAGNMSYRGKPVYSDPYSENPADRALFYYEQEAGFENAIEFLKDLIKDEEDVATKKEYQDVIRCLQDINGWEEPQRILYTVDIPDDNGHNYLDWVITIPKSDRRRIADAVRRLDGEPAESVKYSKYTGGWEQLANMIERNQWAYQEVRDRLVQAFGGRMADEKRVSELMHEAGFVGVKYPAEYRSGGRGDGAKNYVIFDEGDLKITDKIRFQKAADGEYEPKPTFYSNAMNAVEGIKQEKATAEQWLAMLQKNGGLKAGEDKWTGLSDWLNDHKGKSLTKQEVMDYIKENQIEVEEVEYSDAKMPGNFASNLRNELNKKADEICGDVTDEYADKFAKAEDFSDELDDIEDEMIQEARRRLDDEFGVPTEHYISIQFENDRNRLVYTPTRSDRDFSNNFAQQVWNQRNGNEGRPINETRLQYTTDGLENKREIALTVPTVEPWNEGDEIHFGDAGEGRAVAWVRFGETTMPSDEQVAAAKAVDDYLAEMREKYGSAEGVETDQMTEGEIAHLQSLTSAEAEAKNNPGKRVLVIDEIQSKRHQEGREKGYIVNPERKALLNWYEQKQRKYGVERHRLWEYLTEEEDEELTRLQDEARLNSSGNSTGIPDAPFDRNWHELAMKRMLRYAAENGYDKVAWTTGEQQANRYDLSKSIKDMTATGWTDYSAVRGDDAKESKLISINTIDGGEYAQLLVDKSGKVISDVDDQFVGKQLSDIVGKDLAKRLMEDGYQTIEGEGLRIGGEGMKGFYDQILPRFMDKYGKKWGVKTGEVELPNIGDNGLTMHSVDVTPEMKASVLEGQPMFFRDKDGEVIGYTLGGEIYIDPRYAKPETPVHEYAHLIVHAIRTNNPQVWERWKELAHGEQDVIDFVKEKYPEYSENEDDFWEEVIANYTGREGGKRLEDEMRRQMRETTDIVEKARIATIFHKLRDLLKRFWEITKDIFAGNTKGIDNFKSMDDVVDLTLAALANKFDPRTAQRAAEEKTLMGVHNISEEKLKKALKKGGFANPSMAVIDTKNGGFDSYGDISLIPKASLIDSRSGRNAGTYGGDAWTPTYPGVEYYEGKETAEKLKALTAGLPESLGEYIRRRVSDYMDKNYSTSGLEYLFLKEHGIDMPIAHNKRRYPNISNKEIYERIGVSENIYGSDLYKEYEKMPQEQLFDFNLWLDKYGDAAEIAKVNDMIARLRGEGKDEAATFLIDRYSKPMTFANFDSHVHNVGSDEREAGSENLRATIENAAMEVDKQGLRNEFDAWLEKQIDNLGYEERLFAGYTPAGYRRYLPNTLENASRLMNRESDVNAYDNTSLSATRAALMYKMQSLDDIRKHRDLLQKGDGYDESYKEMSDKMLDVAHRLSDMQVISDNTFMNTDYAILRMQEAFTKKDPIGYLNKEYGYSIDKDSEFATDMLTFMDEVKDMPVKYFETKFKRPVMLDEFEVAVVPDNVDADVRKALEDAGLTVVDYEHGNEESRHEAAMNAVRGREGIMFQKAGTYTTKDGVQLSMMSLFEEGNLNDNANLNERSSANGDLTELRLRKLEPSETCHVERRYEENKSFSFTGKEKIESMDDVAYIFKQLENAAVENSFIALVKDGKPIIIHTGMGGYTSSPVDIRQAVAAYMSINPEQVYFVHNHPSGSLRASKDDRLTLNLLREVFGNDVMQDGIIIDTTSGKYGVFGPEIGEGEFGWGLGEKNRGEVPMKVYEFSKQVFSKDWKPQTAYTIAGSEGVAEFISSHRLGEHPKMSFIIVNNRGQVVGNFFLPWTALSEIEDVKATCTELSNYINLAGGTKGIIYGNYQYSEKDKRMLQQLAAGMNVLRTPLLDVVHVDVNDELGYHSAHDSGVMEPEAEYVTPEREAGESILDYAKRVADDYSAYESIVKALEVANGGVMEAHDDSVSDIMDDQSMGMQERMTAMAIKIAALHADDAAAKNRAYRAIGGNLAALRKAMSLQKEFDRSTVKRVADLARWLLSGGYLDKLSRYEVGRLLSAVKNATGKTDIRPDIKKVMDIMVDNQLKRAEKLLHDLETVKAKKVNAKGVEVQGELDLAGQQMITAFKKGRALSSKEALEQHIADAQDRMGSSNQTIADEAANEYTGLQLALQYADDIKGSEDEESDLRDELERARLEARRPDGIFADKEAYDQYRASIEDNIRQNRIERLQAYLNLAASLTGSLGESVKNALAFNEAEKERVADIQHNANSDMEGRPSKEHYTPDWKAKTVNNPFAQFFLQPLATFDQMLRLFGGKSANGEGYLYNRFMRGWVDARWKEIRGVHQKYAALDAKVKQLFGKDASNMADLIRRIGNMPKMTVQFWDGGAMRDHTLTQGNLMYIYMVDKMDDGRLKLRAMGVKEEDVAKITRALDPRLIELADWLQDEFLVETRNEYNETHKRLFGASMAAIDKYFPLKILANARADKPEDLDNPNFNEGVSTTTGSIIKRRRNALALDVLNSNALNVVLDHVAQMEHWNAFAEFNRDLNTLRTYKRFRNQVQNMTTVYGSGKELWKKFNDVSQMAAGSYRPPRATLDEAAVNIAKGVTAAKVSFRVFTALKQFLSMPAYIPDARPDLWAKNLATPWNSWNWAMDNLPIFEERWKGRIAGDPRLLKSELDWKGWRNRIVQMASRIGMAPNAFVDALTVSIGAKSIYETRRARYLKEGYSEEQADQRARQDAEIAYNETQQSSEGAFLSPMQVDRSWLSVMFTVFRSSSMSYQRQLHDALRNLKRDLKKGNREQSIEFESKKLQRDGLPEDKAQAAAKSRYDRQMGKDLLRVATFGYILQLAWNLGAKLPYLLFGDDDDKKDEMMDDVWAQSMFGWGEGLTGGDVFSQGGKMLVQGKGNPEYLMKEMPIASDAKDVLQELGQGKYGEVVNDIVNLVVQAGIGVNPQSITDAVLAIMDACGDDPALAHEATIAVMRILQVPQSQIKEMYFDELGLSGSEVSNYTPQQLVERYAQYQVKRGRLLAPWTWDDESILDKERKKATKVVKERVGTFGDEFNEALDGYEQTYNEVKERINTAYNEAKQEHDYIKKAQIIDEVLRSDEQAFTTYDDYKRCDKQLDDIVTKYLAAKTPEQASLAKDDIFGFKSRMVELLGTADERQRRKLRFQLNEYYSDFKKEYETAAPPPQQ